MNLRHDYARETKPRNRSQHVASPGAQDTGPAERRVVLVALALNLLVAAAKITYGQATSALSIEADGYHSLTDGLVSLVALVGLFLARRPPDSRHPYGHRKLEIVATLFIGLSLLLLAAEIAVDVVRALGTDHATPRIGGGAFVVLLATLAVNLGVSSYQARVGRRLSSPVLLADAQHTRADCFTTGGVLVATLLTWLGYPELDVVAAGVVAVFVGKAGVDVVRENAGYLLDVALVAPDDVVRVVESIPPVSGVHTVRTRGTPSAIFMDLRISLPAHLDLATTDDVVRSAVAAIRSEFPHVVDVVVRPEAA